MRRGVAAAFGLAAWAAAAFAALSVAALPGEFGHDWCGPWGCYPPPQALAAMHLFWAVLLVPPAAWACRRLPPAVLRKLGLLLVAVGGTAVALLVAREAATWLPSVPADARRYFGRRVAYALATLTDFPVLQIVAVGLACLFAARHRRIVEPAPVESVA